MCRDSLPLDSRGEAVLLVAAVLIAALQVRVAAERQVFELRTLEARFRLAGETVRDRLPAGATAIAVWDSGSIRYHAGNEVVLWDSLDPSWLDRAAAWLENDGRTAVVVVERWEESRFRERFAGQQFGGLDWPPRFDVDNRVRVFVMAESRAIPGWRAGCDRNRLGPVNRRQSTTRANGRSWRAAQRSHWRAVRVRITAVRSSPSLKFKAS